MQTVVNLRTGERRRLADYVGVDEGEPIGSGVAGRFSWTFVSESVRWGRHELDRCLTGSTDLLVIDQLGPLELLAGSGWANAVRRARGRGASAWPRRRQPAGRQRSCAGLLAGADVVELEVGPADVETLAERLVQLALERRLTPGS